MVCLRVLQLICASLEPIIEMRFAFGMKNRLHLVEAAKDLVEPSPVVLVLEAEEALAHDEGVGQLGGVLSN